tara:strand:+ start:401 stop:1771 length:1371 start_codon:yes stop_codon:yes gene_type:complete
MAKINKIHLIGVGGAGMSGIAEILVNLNYKVSGSDNCPSEITRRLEALGVECFYEHADKNINNVDLIVISSAIGQKNPEVIFGLNQGIPIIKRAEMLANLMMLKNSIAIAGSHGKTTTTCILAHIFTQCNLDPTYIIGGKIKAFESNASLGKGPHILAEADESDGSFLLLRPHKSIITNIDNDHLETYEGDFEKLKDAFKEFCLNIPFQGKIVSFGDSNALLDVLKNIPRNIVTYGFNKSNDFQIINLIQSEEGSSFDLIDNLSQRSQNFRTPMHGEHNVLNAVAAIVMSLDEGISFDQISTSLESCSMVERRFEIISKDVFGKGITLVDDYGHHPQEIKATLETVNKIWKKQKKIVIFQPHRYTRTKALFNEFIEVLSTVDDLILMEVYPASEEVIKGYETKDLINALPKNIKVIEAKGIEDAFAKLKNLVDDHSIILTQGAGNTSSLAKLIANS